VNTHRFLFYLLLVLLPTQLTKYFFPEFALVNGIRVDYLAPVIYLTDLIIIAIIVFWLIEYVAAASYAAKNKARKVRAATLILFGTTIVIAINIFFAINPTIAFLKWLRIIETGFLVFYILKAKPNLRFTIYCLLFAGFYSCILAWIQFIYQSSIGGILWWIGERTFTVTTSGIARTIVNNQLFLRPYATFPHPNVLAGFLTCLIPFIFYLKNLNKITQLLFIPTLILFLATLVITFSQSAWIIALITTLIFIVKERHIRLTTPAVFLGLVIFTLILSFISYQFVEKESIARRIAVTNNAFSIIQENPLFGVGLNNFIIANQQNIQVNSYQDLQPVHSIYLLFAAEMGIVGILLFVLVLFYLYKKTRIGKDSFYIIWPLATLLLLGLFDHYPLTIHQTLLFISILTGFIYSTSLSVIHLHKGKHHDKRSK